MPPIAEPQAIGCHSRSKNSSHHHNIQIALVPYLLKRPFSVSSLPSRALAVVTEGLELDIRY